MEWGKYNLIETKDKLKALDEYLIKNDKPVFDLMAFDTETNGLLFFKNVIIGFSISVNAQSGFYIPLLVWEPTGETKTKKLKKELYSFQSEGHFRDVWTGLEYPETVSPKEYQPPEFIKKYLKRWLSQYVLLMHNAPFDCSMVHSNFGFNPAENLFCDTGLLKHFLNENTRNGLKDIAALWKKDLGFNPDDDATQEQKELGTSVIKNGGTFNQRSKMVWRADGDILSKYAIADTFLTYGIFEVGMRKFKEKYSEKHWNLFFNDEIMPLCREVVIPMKLHGVFIDVPYFQKLEAETAKALSEFEDRTIQYMSKYLVDFDKGDSLEKAVTKKALIEAIIAKEGLQYPKQLTKGQVKQSLAKKAIQTAYNNDPHWLWGYLLGEDEIRYSPEELEKLKLEIYQKKLGRKHRFNIRSKDHLRWLLFTKLKHDPRSVKQTDSATKEKPIPSVDEEVLSDHFAKKYKFIRTLVIYNKLYKLHSSYILPALALNNNGWLHLDLKQNGTTSGRFSCSGGFNLQTLPKVEEDGACPKCESKKISFKQNSILLKNMECFGCGHTQQDMICYSAIKAGFIAPPGKKIINADFSSLEPRCFAYMSGDEKLKAVYKQNLDLYSKVYCDMLDPEHKYSADPEAPNYLKKQNKAARDLVKPVVLGIPYGALPPQVARLMDLKKTIEDRNHPGKFKEVLDVERGKHYRDLYLNTYSKLKEYMEECELLAIGKGYIETIIGRRRRFKYAQFICKLIAQYNISIDEFMEARYKDFEGVTTPQGLDRGGLEYFAKSFEMNVKLVYKKGNWNYIRGLLKNELNNAKNFPIQGLAAHITNKAMLDAVRSFRQNGTSGTLILQVHDEITGYSDDSDAELNSKLLKRAMEENEFAKKIDIPMSAEPIICDNLKDSK